MCANLGLRNVYGVRVLLLISLEARGVFLVRELPGWRNEAKAFIVYIHGKAHSSSENVFVRKKLNVWVPVGHLSRVGLNPAEDVFVGQIGVHPAKCCSITILNLLPLWLRSNELKQKRLYMVRVQCIDLEFLRRRSLLLLRLLGNLGFLLILLFFLLLLFVVVLIIFSSGLSCWSCFYHHFFLISGWF